MSNPFVAEIRIVGFNFAPSGWAMCNGQILPISQNTALFSLLGTTYGGDGKSNFALPNMAGSVPMAPGLGPGLSLHDLGEQSGSETITLLNSDIPGHNHPLVADSGLGDATDPTNRLFGAEQRGTRPAYYSATATSVQTMSPLMMNPTGPGWGQNLPVSIMQPVLVLNFIIAMQGVFPPRT